MNEKDISNLSSSKRTAAKTIFAALEILKENDGELPGKEIISEIPSKIDLNDWEKERYAKSGYIRWQSILHFYSIDCSKAGFLRKNNGIWYLTKEGEENLSLGPVKLLEKATKRYKLWKKEKDSQEVSENELVSEDETDDEEQLIKANLEQIEDNAIEGIREYIKNKNPYEFQDLCAALLRGMNYHTPYISPRGKDGGIDIIAYQDPLGATIPRIKVQVKHKPNSSIPVDDIRSLAGLLSKDGDIGLFITSGRYTSESERFARDSHKHIKLIHMEDFIILWKESYNKLIDDDKALLPIKPIYFVGT